MSEKLNTHPRGTGLFSPDSFKIAVVKTSKEMLTRRRGPKLLLLHSNQFSFHWEEKRLWVSLLEASNHIVTLFEVFLSHFSQEWSSHIHLTEDIYVKQAASLTCSCGLQNNPPPDFWSKTAKRKPVVPVKSEWWAVLTQAWLLWRTLAPCVIKLYAFQLKKASDHHKPLNDKDNESALASHVVCPCLILSPLWIC